MAAKGTDWRPGPAVCRCCFAEGCYKDISTEYFWMGKREVYSEMLSTTFDVSIAYSQSTGPNSNSRLICEPCISRLRDASDFKRQVVECEKTFMQHLDPGSSNTMDLEIHLEAVEKEEVKLERVKVETKVSDDEFDDGPGFPDDDDDDLDDEPLTKLASKVPKKETVDFLDLLDNSKPEKRKATTKPKAPPAKKPKKREAPKASASKPPAKPEKKKKETGRGVSRIQMAKRNAEIVVRCSSVYPFRLQRQFLMCVFCLEEFEDPADFRHHMDEAHKTYSLRVAFGHCGKGKDYLKVDCTNLKCKICQKPFETLEEISNHIVLDHECKKLNLKYDVGLQPYKLHKDKWNCYVCNQKLASLKNLCRHTTSHYQKYTCDTCGRCYLTTESLKYHIRCSHTAGQNVCRKCWKSFPTLDDRKEHIKTSKSCRPFCCLTCGDRFTSWDMKQKHLIESHGKPRFTYDCPDCSEKFGSRSIFYKHFKVAHTDENFVCSCCGQKFGTKRHLEDHRLKHTGEKLFGCTVCLKTFSRDKNLKQHMWIHSEKKRFTCSICDRQFAQKVSLEAHLKNQHQGAEIIYE